MKIDWKHLATTEGYKSLKAAYTHDVEEAAKMPRPMRDKEEFLRRFRWVIGRAVHYAHHTGRSIEDVLIEWEKGRSYWWLNYYQNNRQPKLHSGSIKTEGLKGLRKHYQKIYRGCKGKVHSAMQSQRTADSARKSGKTKPRWSSERKLRGY